MALRIAAVLCFVVGSLSHPAQNNPDGVFHWLLGQLRILEHGSAEQSFESAKALLDLIYDAPEHAASLVSSGAAPSLVKLLVSESDVHQMIGIKIIAELASSKQSPAIAAAGAIQPLVRLISVGTDEQKWHGSVALVALAENSMAIANEIVSAGAIDPLVQLYQQPSANEFDASPSSPIETLVSLLDKGSNGQKHLSAMCLVDLAKDDPDIAKQLVSTGAIQCLRELTRKGSDGEKLMSTKALMDLSEFH